MTEEETSTTIYTKVIDAQQLLANRRASGWLPALAIAQAVNQGSLPQHQTTEDKVVESLSVYGEPKLEDDGHFFRWNWVYEWAKTQFKPEGHENYIRETAQGVLEQADGDMDRALSAALQHTANLWPESCHFSAPRSA